MLNLLKLFYKLNRENFFSSFPILYELNLSYKKLIYNINLIFRVLIFVGILFIINIYTAKTDRDLSFYYALQILITLFSVLVFSSASTAQDKNTNSLKFLLSKIFNDTEIIKNVQLISIYYALISFITTLGIELSVINYFTSISFFTILNSLFIASETYLYVYYENKKRLEQTYMKKEEVRHRNWFMSYIFALFISGWGVFYLQDFKKIIFSFSSINFNQIGNLLTFILGSLEIYLIIKIALYKIIKRKYVKKRDYFFIKDGLVRDYFENYIKYSAYWYVIPPILIRVVEIQPIRKILLIIVFTSFMMTPNYCNLKMINYQKVIGVSNNRFILGYAKKIFSLFMVVQLIQLILAGIGTGNIFIGMVISVILFVVRAYIGKFIVSIKISDMKKADLYAIFVFSLLILNIALAVYLK
ncbi:MAG: hypothetical protein Q4A90_04155 [Streptococcus sp.]|nr:hypothetical protein [Streptococcus sp.]